MIYDLVMMATALSFEGGGGSGAVIRALSASANGVYRAADYDCDGFEPVVVNVNPGFSICPKASIDDVIGIVDPEYTEEEDEGDIKCTGTYIFDADESYTLACVIADNGHLLWVGKVWSSGWTQEMYSNRTDLIFAFAYVSSIDSSTGTFYVTYAFTFDPSRVRTISRTKSELTGYGASGHTLEARRVSWWI